MSQLSELILLAILQGLTEFLPVSSSGHLVLAMAFMEKLGWSMQASVTVNVALHIGTLCAIVAYFRRQLVEVVTRQWRLAALVVVGTVPAGIVGVLLRKWAETTLESPWVATAGLVITGILLVISGRLGQGSKLQQELSFRQALLIGCFQAVAVLPGISRSGSTIVGGLLCGLAPREAGVFSFLLAVPVMIGAGLLEVVEVLTQPEPGVDLPGLILAAACAGVVGWIAIDWVMRWVQTGRLYLFAFWVWVVAALGLGFLLVTS